MRWCVTYVIARGGHGNVVTHRKCDLGDTNFDVKTIGILVQWLTGLWCNIGTTTETGRDFPAGLGPSFVGCSPAGVVVRPAVFR